VEKMKITYIKTKGFRKFEDEFETNLYDVTTITGGNTKGKTNILYAIVWAFLGTNITGDDKVFLGNKNVSDCYLKLKFIDNLGEEHTLERYKNRFTNENNFIMLDNKKVDQKEISKFYGEKKLWLSIINPNYFINKSPAEQKELIDKYLPNLDVSIVYDKLDEKEKMYLEGVPNNMVQYLKEINSNRTMYENKIELLRGKIAYAENIVNTPIEEIQVFEKEEELSLARQELSFLSTDENAIHKEKQQKIVDGLEQQIKQQQEQIEQLSNKMTTGKKVYLSIKSEDVAHCPMCEQVIQNENRMITIKNMKVELEKYFEERTKLEQELLNNKSKLSIERCKLHSFDGIDNTEKNQQIENVKSQIHTLEQEKLEIEKHNNSILNTQKNIDSAKKDISTFEEQIHQCNQILNNIKETKKVAQKLYINYLEEKMKFATKHLTNVKIKYYSILKDTGEIKEDFIITYNDNDLKTLSRSESIATSLELCNMFNKISRVNSPLFVDDSESCADYNFIESYSNDSQIIITRVEKGQELKIEDANLEKNVYSKVA
jgi:hypothetical protein